MHKKHLTTKISRSKASKRLLQEKTRNQIPYGKGEPIPVARSASQLLRQEARRLDKLTPNNLTQTMIWSLNFAAAKLDVIMQGPPEYIGPVYKLERRGEP